MGCTKLLVGALSEGSKGWKGMPITCLGHTLYNQAAERAEPKLLELTLHFRAPWRAVSTQIVIGSINCL